MIYLQNVVFMRVSDLKSMDMKKEKNLFQEVLSAVF